MIKQTTGTFLVNDREHPLRFGKVNLINPPRREIDGRPPREGILCQSVLTGFCGTDWELARMGREGILDPKFPAGQERLINGHEGVVWVPSQKRYAVVLVRGGDAADPSRYESGDTYFEYGCDGADGLMSMENYYHPDMLLEIPGECLSPGQALSRRLAYRLVFADPMACMLFQAERIADLLAGHNRRLFEARGIEDASGEAVRDGFSRVVIYGLGTTGILAAIAIKESRPDARIVTIARSSPENPKYCFLQKHWPSITYVRAGEDISAMVDETIERLGGRPRVFIGASGNPVEAEAAFRHGMLDNNGIYASFSLGPVISYDSMPFGFKNQLIFGAINFRRDHMEEAIRFLGRLPMEELVEEFPLDELAADPAACYRRIYQTPDRPLKSVCAWHPERLA